MRTTAPNGLCWYTALLNMHPAVQCGYHRIITTREAMSQGAYAPQPMFLGPSRSGCSSLGLVLPVDYPDFALPAFSPSPHVATNSFYQLLPGMRGAGSKLAAASHSCVEVPASAAAAAIALAS